MDMTDTGLEADRGTILIADDHPLFRGALKQALSGIFTELQFIESGTLEETTAALSSGADIDLILLDLKMPGVSGFSGLTFLRSQFPAVPVVILGGVDAAATDRPQVPELMRLGVRAQRA
jgi:DNA-binding NarL/FixJ family response regulator